VIRGIGVDVVNVQRVQQVHERHGDQFARRILHPEEMARFQDCAQPARFLAKAFAVKEAFVKALGTGFRGIAHDEIGAGRDDLGRPYLVFSERLTQRLQHEGVAATHVSISDERDLVCAFVVLECAGEAPGPG
jgi:holo-[acyl-carrier protein] synthase